MGIPRLYSILLQQWPSLVQPPSSSDTCDVLFIDMSSYFHSCLAASTTESEAISQIIYFTRRIVKLSRPRKLTYLAFDGIPPLAKLKHQFERRNQLARGSDRSHVLTPGTVFLQKLYEEVKKWSEELVTDTHEVIVSGPSEPGEGEQKIFMHLRSIIPTHKNVVVYGLDADLIVMSMVIKDCFIRIMREASQTRYSSIQNRCFEIMSIPRLKESLLLNYDNFPPELKDKVTRDIAFTFTIYGNDFMPTPHGYELGTKLFLDFMEMLRGLHHVNIFLTTDDFELDHIGWKIFCTKVADREQLGYRPYYVGSAVSKTDVKAAAINYLQGLQWLTRYLHTGKVTDWYYEHNFTPTFSNIQEVSDVLPVVDFTTTPLVFKPTHQIALVLPNRASHLLPDCYRNSKSLKDILEGRSEPASFFRKDNISRVVALCVDELDWQLSTSDKRINGSC